MIKLFNILLLRIIKLQLTLEDVNFIAWPPQNLLRAVNLFINAVTALECSVQKTSLTSNRWTAQSLMN